MVMLATRPWCGLYSGTRCHHGFLLTNAIQCYTLSYVRKKLTAIRLKPEQIARLEKIATREDVPVSWLIRKAIDEFLKRQK